MNADSVFYFALAKIVQQRSPSFVCFQIVGHMFGEHDVPGIAAIHHRWAMLIPAPATFIRSVTSTTPLTGPL